LDSSMKLSSKSTNLKTRLPIGHSSMGGKKCTSWITWRLWIIVDHSFTWMLVTQALSQYHHHVWVKSIQKLCILMNISNIYQRILVI
jgi:hypothetical protein